MTDSNPRILFLAQEFPWPLDRGGKLRTFHTLLALSQSFSVDVIAFADSGFEASVIDEFRLACPSVQLIETVPHRVRPRGLGLGRTLLRSYIKRTPYLVEKFANPDVCARAQHRAMANPDAIFVSHLAMFAIARDIASRSERRIPIILDEHNIEYRMWRDFEDAAPLVLRPVVRRESARLLDFETRAWTQAAGIVCICDEDASDVTSFVTAHKVAVFRPCIPMVPMREPATDRPPVIGLIGQWSWPPSGISMDWFLQHVVPPLRGQFGQVDIRIAGAGLNARQRRAAADLGCDVLGYVDDGEAFYRSVGIIAAPDRTGGGVRLKTLNAIAHGLPVAGTPLSFRGLGTIDGKDCLIGESDQDLATALVRLLSDPSLRDRLGSGAAEYYRTFHDRDIEQRRLVEFVNEALVT